MGNTQKSKETISGKKRKREQINKNNTNSPKKKLKRCPSRNFAGRTGLRNLGNTCYFNSSVQCLNSTETFRTFFLNLPRLVPEGAITAPLPTLPALPQRNKNNKNEK